MVGVLIYILRLSYVFSVTPVKSVAFKDMGRNYAHANIHGLAGCEILVPRWLTPGPVGTLVHFVEIIWQL